MESDGARGDGEKGRKGDRELDTGAQIALKSGRSPDQGFLLNLFRNKSNNLIHKNAE